MLLVVTNDKVELFKESVVAAAFILLKLIRYKYALSIPHKKGKCTYWLSFPKLNELIKTIFICSVRSRSHKMVRTQQTYTATLAVFKATTLNLLTETAVVYEVNCMCQPTTWTDAVTS